MGNIEASAYNSNGRMLGEVLSVTSSACGDCSSEIMRFGNRVYGYIGNSWFNANINTTLRNKLDNTVSLDRKQVKYLASTETRDACATLIAFNLPDNPCVDGKYIATFPIRGENSSRFFHIPDMYNSITSTLSTSSMGAEFIGKSFKIDLTFNFSNIVTPKYGIDLSGQRTPYNLDAQNTKSGRDQYGSVVVYYGSIFPGGAIMPTMHRVRTRYEYNPNNPNQHNILRYDQTTPLTPGWKIGYITAGDANNATDTYFLVDKNAYKSNGEYVGTVFLGRAINFPDPPGNPFRKSKNRTK